MTNKSVAHWLFLTAALAGIMVVFGGLVRLTYSGLSMVEWHVVTGAIPPIGDAAWQEVFTKYKQSPEYQLVNAGMSLQEFKFIFLMEYGHRILGRIIGLIFIVPFLVFWRKKRITKSDLPVFAGIGFLLAFQGFFGWYMVRSGLIDQPQVSHFRLTGHLLLALAFLAACLWTGLYWLQKVQPLPAGRIAPKTRRLGVLLLAFLILQLALGGMVAGMRAGTVSHTFPTMEGSWIPPLLFSLQPGYKNLLENPILLHFLHRWNAFIVLLLAIFVYARLRREHVAMPVQRATFIVLNLTLIQAFLGVATILLHVPLVLASLHQAVALLLFVSVMVQTYYLLKTGQPAAEPVPAQTEMSPNS